MIIKAKPPGQPVTRVDKRAVESIVYSIDLTELLLPNELASAVDSIDSKLETTDIKIKHGKTVEVRIPSQVNNAPGTPAHMDYTINILVSTSLNNVRAAVFSIRVYK